MIDFDSHFHLTLIGISVTDFCEIEKNGIEKFLAKKRNLEDAHAIDDQKKRKKNETNNIPSGEKRTGQYEEYFTHFFNH